VERKVCRGRVFNSKAVGDICKGQGHSTLSRAYLTEYFNELVIQLKLAEYNLNQTIAMEVKESYRKAALDNEAFIIKIMNENILPALEFMVSSKFNYDNFAIDCLFIHGYSWALLTQTALLRKC